MIDWKNVKPEDFRIRFDVDEIDQAGDTLFFPVSVYTVDGEKVFTKLVPIRAEFYFELRALDTWNDSLKKIIKNRVRDDIQERIKTERVAIQDKIALLSDEGESI